MELKCHSFLFMLMFLFWSPFRHGLDDSGRILVLQCCPARRGMLSAILVLKRLQSQDILASLKQIFKIVSYVNSLTWDQ